MKRMFLALAALAVSMLGSLSVHAAGVPRKVIVDDDVFTLHATPAFLLQAPDVDVLGITIVSGSIWRDEAVAHALRMTELMGRTDVTVVPGSAYPLVNTELATKRWESLYGRLIWKGAWMDERWENGTLKKWPYYHAHDVVPKLAEGNPSTHASAEIAADFLVRKVREFPGQVTIIATGPMTNIALAQRLDPSFAENAKELIYMGGSLNPQLKGSSEAAAGFGHEYANTPRLEFNFRWDPEAASIVMRAPWKRIVMVPIDPSTSTELSPKLLDAMTTAATPFARALRQFSRPGFPLWDEIAAAVWLQPSLITVSQQLDIDVDTVFAAGYGNTLSWPVGQGPGLGERSQIVVREVDVPALERALIELANRPTPQASSSRP